MNKNLIGNCLPIMLTILNFQKINMFQKRKKIIRIASIICSIIGGVLILLLSNNNEQAALEWFLLYSVGFLVWEHTSKNNNKSYSTEIGSDEIVHYKFIFKACRVVGIVVLFFTFSSLFDKLFLNSEIYILARFNYVVCSVSYFLYSYSAFKFLKKYDSDNKSVK